jgi:hypothetical protein
MNITIEKSPLIIPHGLAQAMAEVESSNFDDRKTLRADVTVNGKVSRAFGLPFREVPEGSPWKNQLEK